VAGGPDAAHLSPIDRSPYCKEYALRPLELSCLVWTVPTGT
jgi:hypothetical protein